LLRSSPRPHAATFIAHRWIRDDIDFTTCVSSSILLPWLDTGVPLAAPHRLAIDHCHLPLTIGWSLDLYRPLWLLEPAVITHAVVQATLTHIARWLHLSRLNLDGSSAIQHVLIGRCRHTSSHVSSKRWLLRKDPLGSIVHVNNLSGLAWLQPAAVLDLVLSLSCLKLEVADLAIEAWWLP